jgi:ketosteroid isomerase-like protein
MSKLFLTAEQTNQQFVNYLALGDAAKISTMYAKDAEFLGPHMKFIKGRENITTAHEYIFAEGITRMLLTTDHVIDLGTYHFLEGSYTLKETDGKTRDTGKYSILWMRENGCWRINRGIFNSDFRSAHSLS